MTAVIPIASTSRWTGDTGPKLRVIRKPSLRVRQAVRDNNVALLSRLQHKTDLRNTDKDRLTSLSWAAIEGSLEVFEWLLLDYGHDDQELSRDADNNTIFHLLASVPSPPTLSPYTHLLLSSPNFPPVPPSKSHADLTAISCRMTEIYFTLFPFLLDWSNSGGKTALHVAAQAGNSAFIALLCDLGADVDLTDLQGNSPLHYAAAWGHLESIKILLERGCQFAARNFEGFTASEFAYSNTVMKALQDIARDLFEERRNRRKEEKAEASRSTSSLGREYSYMSESHRRRDPNGDTSSQQNGSAMRLRSGSVSTSASQGSGLSSGTRYQDSSPVPPIPSSSNYQSYPDVRRSADVRTNQPDPPSPAPSMTRMASDGPRPPRPNRNRTGSASQYPPSSQMHIPTGRPEGVYPQPRGEITFSSPVQTNITPRPDLYATTSSGSQNSQPQVPGIRRTPSTQAQVEAQAHSYTQAQVQQGQSPVLQPDQIPRRTREGSLSSSTSVPVIAGGVGLGLSGGMGMRRGGSGSGNHGQGQSGGMF